MLSFDFRLKAMTNDTNRNYTVLVFSFFSKLQVSSYRCPYHKYLKKKKTRKKEHWMQYCTVYDSKTLGKSIMAKIYLSKTQPKNPFHRNFGLTQFLENIED
jgi:hypothetical protein